MVRIKTPSPPPSGGGGDEEVERFDLYVPDVLRLVGSSGTPKSGRKRSSAVHSASPSAKRANTAASSSASGSAAPGASPGSKKKASQAKTPQKPRVKAPKIIFGIDFGTTYSGIAYAYSGNPEKIDILMSWDNTNSDYVKIPSAIKFDDSNDIWGVKAKHLSDALRWFKLTLVNTPDLDVGVRNSTQVQDARAALEALEMSPVEAISAYLKHMWEHCIKKLKVAEGADTVNSSRFHVIFTVPAIWPNYARERMKQAVEQAGILKRRPAGQTDHDFVSEPEAAALATMSSIEGRHNIMINDAFVIVDCGGGTVDIITYKTSQIDPMTLQELVKGRGALCGAVFVDERFKNLLITKLQAIRPDAMQRVSDKEMQEMMSRDWENEIRNEFDGTANTWTIRLPFSLIDASQLDHNSGYPTFSITSEEVAEIFRPTMEKIHTLVARQIDTATKRQGTPPKYVILVGGFGSSKYLCEYLQNRCQDVEILQRRGSEPWSAISRGAVLYGLTKLKIHTPFSVDIGSRIARVSWGIACQEPFDPTVHLPEDMWFDPDLRKNVAVRVMKWHLVQGQDIYVDRDPSFPLTKHLAKPPKKMDTTIYMSRADVPPARRDGSVKEIFKLKWDIQIDWDSLPTFVNDQGQTFRQLEYNVKMKCSAGVTDFAVYHGGYKQAGKNVSLEVYENADV